MYLFDHKWTILKDNDNNNIGGQSDIYIDSIKTKIKKKYKIKQKEQYINELNILRLINHSNIIKLLDYNNLDYSLVLPFYDNGCVFDYYYKEIINSNDFNKLHFIKRLSCDVLNAIMYLHNLNITHYDIKCENIVINKNNQFILIDFGLSINKISKLDLFCGTIDYMAPEIWLVRNNKQQFYNYKIDIFSFGCMILEMINEYNPFYNSETKKYYKCYYYIDFFLNTDDSMIFDPIFNSNDWSSCKIFIKQCISENPINRYSASRLLDDNFLII
jgi:serine/threonine protein kinase